MQQINGVINILKPPGMTSHDVVSFLRRVTGIKKIGHTGTLDPGAAGVLPVCIGKATKIVDYIMAEDKTYIAELTLGNKTDTYDKYGDFLYSSDNYSGSIEIDHFNEVLKEFTGEIEQVPPAYSAIKINGVRAYDLAREGIKVEIKPRRVTVHSIEIRKFDPPFVLMQVSCSKGTYIRSICNDIGEVIGCGAYMSFLLRSQTGRFNIENSCVLEDIKTIDDVKKNLIGIDEVLDMGSVYVDTEYTTRLLNGNQIELKDCYADEPRFVKVYLKPDNFVAVGRICRGTLSIEKMLV